MSDVKPTSQTFILADQSDFKILGTIDIDISLHGLIVPFTFTVAQTLIDKCLLGADFLKATGATLDFGGGVVHFFDGLVTLPLLSAETEQSLARIAHNVSIPPQSEALIQAYVPHSFLNRDLYLEQTPTLQTRGIALARSLVRPTKSGTIVCRILNPLNTAMRLKAKTPIGIVANFNAADPFNTKALKAPFNAGQPNSTLQRSTTRSKFRTRNVCQY